MDNLRRFNIAASLAALSALTWLSTVIAADTNGHPDSDLQRVSTESALIKTTENFMHNAHGFVANIDSLSKSNQNFRKVLYTAKHAQLVLMALKPGEDIGTEVHPNVDQFFRVEEGSGEAILDNVHTQIQEGYAVLVPAGTEHNIVNTGKTPMKLYTVYAPPQHRDAVIQRTRAQARQAHEHFDGMTTR